MLDSIDDLIQHAMLHHRWIFVIFFLLPATVIYELFIFARNWINFQRMAVTPLDHDKHVKYVQQQVKEWKSKHSDKQMCTARPGWQTMSFRRGRYKATMFNVSLNMHNILEVNLEQEYVKVEPLVSMGQLTGLLNPLGWTIPVVPEMEDLTVGGMLNGTGIESSSHKYGLFQHICRAFEIVLCDGSLVRCSREENSDLFYAVIWAHGTLGFVVSIDLNIIPACKYVKLHYQPVRTLKESAEAFQKAQADMSNDFVEGIQFDLNNGVIMTGVMDDGDENTQVNRISRWYKPWFFKHVEAKLEESLPTEAFTEYIPLRDYYHRHTRGLFWEMQDIVPFGNNAIFRLLLGWAMPPKVSLLKLTQTKSLTKLYEDRHMMQDLLMPTRHLEEAVLKFDKLVNIYPLWWCPFKMTPEPGFFHAQGDKDEMYVDVALYGVPKASDFDATQTTRKIEKYLADINGCQMLYADLYHTKEEFRQVYDHTVYDKVRKELQCEKAFPELYDKVCKKARV